MLKLRRWGVALLVCALLVLQGWLMGAHLPWFSPTLQQHARSILSATTIAATPTAVVPNQNATPALSRPDFQTGIIFPQTGPTAYGVQDTSWLAGIRTIRSQVAASWIALTLPFEQASLFTTQVTLAPTTPTPAAVLAGILLAHNNGYHVFVQPQLTVAGPYSWAGNIQFSTEAAAQAWFDSYWNTLRPFVVAAAQGGADELAIGSEFEGLQSSWPAEWDQLITSAHALFPGMLTYDMNWTSLQNPVPAWMHHPLLSAIGVTVFTPLTAQPQRLAPQMLSSLWHTKIALPLDAFALALQKPVLISEIGYRDSTDALYDPWLYQTSAAPDDAEQAAAYDAALRNVVTDPHILGIFFWAWSLPPFQPNGHPAAHILYSWYSIT